MIDTAERISGNLEACFAKYGFAEPGVDAVRESAGVSLRTLYKYFPSREDMILGALEFRHRRYLDGLVADMPPGPGMAPVHHAIDRVADWMRREASTGCLFLSALAAHPDSGAIREAVTRHKTEIRTALATCIGRAAPRLDRTEAATAADALFLIHEGQVAATQSDGAERAADTARLLAVTILHPAQSLTRSS